MKYIRKGLAVALITIILLLLSFNTAMADSNIIYETSSKETITSGATLEKITRFTENGWLNIDVLRVDLSNEYIKIDTMINSDSVKKLTSAKALAESRGAVAAINGGFFNWMKEAGSGYPDGPVVESGKIISADNEYNRYNDSMGTFAVNNLNQVLFNYWKTDIALVAPNGNTTVAMQYNKVSRSDYTDFTILDRRWGDTSIGADTNRPDIVEMIVDGGKVTEIRQGQPAASIPQNGYVVVTRQAGSQFINDNFKIGDSVSMNITTTPDWNAMKMAVTGAAILVKDGQIPETFSNNIPGRQPRTAVGSSQDGKQLILATVDGRQNSSIGMTQYEMAALMIELGAYNALNLDGGGSTTMVARTPGTNSLDIMNRPSDGSARGVATAVGIFSIAPPSELDGLIVDTEDTNIFVNTSRDFTVRGYDRYFNPIEVNPDSVTWSVSGVQGTFKGNRFYPTSVGDGRIKATSGNITREIEISVLSSPAQLQLSKKLVKLLLNQSETFTVTGKNKNGYSAKINPADVTWSVKGLIGIFDQNIFKATIQGTGYIDASIGSTHAYCAVSVASDTSMVKDGFEADNGGFMAYPADIGGGYQISAEQKHSGKSSGKLTYDFTKTEGTRAAYLAFSNNGLPIDGSAAKLGLWVYSTHSAPNWLRAEVTDSGGKKHVVEFTKNIDWTGWKFVETSLDDIGTPSALNRIYLVQTSPVSDSGSIYIDDLSVTTSSYPAIDMGKIPQDTAPVDEANKSVTYQKSSDSFRFSVFGQGRNPKNPLENLLMLRFTEKINNYLDAAAFVGGNGHDAAKLVNKPLVSTNTGYKSLDIKGSRFIQLDTNNSGLRAANPAQWKWLLQQINSFTGNNLFVFMEGSPKSFGDDLEGSLLQDVLTQFNQKTGKNVWVFYKSDKNTSYMDRGVKYVTTAGYEVDGLTTKNTDPVKYIIVTVKGNTVTYEFKPVI